MKSHLYILKKGDVSSVSLREIERFREIYEFFHEEYFKNFKNDETAENIEIKSIIMSIYICYYLRLPSNYLRLPSNDLRENYINEVIKKKY